MRSIPPCRCTGALCRARSPRSGSGLVAALFWLFAIVLFAVPFVHDRRVTKGKAQDHNRKTAYWWDEDESSLDLPFLEDLEEFVAGAQAEDGDLGDGTPKKKGFAIISYLQWLGTESLEARDARRN